MADLSPADLAGMERDIKRLQAAADRRVGGKGGGEGRMMTEDQMMEIFNFYSNFGRSAVMTQQASLDSFMFMKMAREMPRLLDKRSLSRTDVDLIFTKAKPKTQRRLDFVHFMDALYALAVAKYPPPIDTRAAQVMFMKNQVLPLHSKVQREMAKTGDKERPLTGAFKRLYDVRNYTGVYAERFRSGDGRINGEADNRVGRKFLGSTNTGTDEVIHDIRVLMRPNLKGGTKMSNSNHVSAKKGADSRSRSVSPRRRRGRSGRSRSRSRSPSPRRARAAAAAPSPAAASPAAAAVASPSPKVPPAPSVVLPEDPTKQTEFLLKALAEARSGRPEALADVTLQLASQLQGVEHSTAAARKAVAAIAPTPPSASSSTATPAAGAGSGVSAGAAAGSSESREEAEAMQREIVALEGGIESLRARLARAATGSEEAAMLEEQLADERDKLVQLRARQSSAVADRRPPALNRAQLETVFDYYANYGRSSVMTPQKSLDSFMFMKFCRECPHLLDGSVLSRTEIDLIFTKAKPKFERRLVFDRFLDALAAIAEKKFPHCSNTDALHNLLSRHLAPLYEVVQVELGKSGSAAVPLKGIFARLYDVSSYTGVYAERFRSGDGRINGDADNRVGRTFLGNTNTGTNEVIHDISSMMRPNLRMGSTTMANSPRVHDSNREAMRSHLRARAAPKHGRRAISPGPRRPPGELSARDKLRAVTLEDVARSR